MAKSLTIKKKKLALASSGPGESEQGAAAPAEHDSGGDGDSPAPAVSEPVSVRAVPVERGASYTVAATFALIVTLLFVVLLLLQWSEYSFYDVCFPRAQIKAPPVPPPLTESSVPEPAADAGESNSVDQTPPAAEQVEAPVE